ncbi:MAG TPA: transposase [Candidatus Saccharimonadales bacterium]|nr:transposase [Candidatus Saccharimonadales bacterium]
MDVMKYKDKYRIDSTRLKGYDYSQNGIYFITICTKNREPYFGEIISGNMYVTEIGKIVQKFWMEIPQHFPFVTLDKFVVMPNHIHGILMINKDKPFGVETQHIASLREGEYINKFQPQSMNISSIIRGYKAGVKTWTVKNNIDFAWQPRFHDRIIRDERELHTVQEYIKNNPKNWEKDELY